MSFFIDIKRKEARDLVIKNLEEWAFIMENGLPSTLDFMPSCSSSLIQVSSDKPNRSADSITLDAIVHGDEYKTWTYRYTCIINSLAEPEREAIENKYINGYTFNEMRYGTDTLVGNMHIKRHLERAYHNIALLDEDIEYTVEDYLAWKCSFKGQENARRRKKERAYVYLSQLNENNKIPEDKMTDIKVIRQCLALIPELQRESLNNYIKKERPLTSYEYRKVKQAICSFMYIHDDFDYEIEEYQNDMSMTRKCWKSCFNHVVREVRIAKEKK